MATLDLSRVPCSVTITNTTNKDKKVNIGGHSQSIVLPPGDQFNKGQLVIFKVVPHQGYAEAPTLTINGVSEDLLYNPQLQAYISQGDPGTMIMNDFEIVASVTA